MLHFMPTSIWSWTEGSGAVPTVPTPEIGGGGRHGYRRGRKFYRRRGLACFILMIFIGGL